MSATSLNIVFQAIHSRRLLLHTPLFKQPSSAAASPSASATAPAESGFDANVVMILAVLLCALICALGLNSIVRCALRCSARMALEPDASPTAARIALLGARRRLLKALPLLVYSAGTKLAGEGSECAICLSEFIVGEKIRVLPKCNHGFHVRCIDQWLISRPSCPTCRQCLFGTCQKVSGCSEYVAGAGQLVIVPFEPEGRVSDYR